jgi:cytosine/adenosine deaminase-related metal-dependent hydrolase
MIDQNVSVSLGADGAACNNRLDMFTEMRTATLLQKALHGPEAIPAELALRMATIDGARALGLEGEIGSLEIGKRADLAVVNLQRLHSVPSEYDPLSALVYSAAPADVETVLIDGRVILRDGELLTLKEESVVENVRREIGPLLQRAGVSVAV